MNIWDMIGNLLGALWLLPWRRRWRNFSSSKTVWFSRKSRTYIKNPFTKKASWGLSSSVSQWQYRHWSSRKNERSQKSGKLKFFVFWVVWLCIVLPVLIWWIWFYSAILAKLPNIADIEKVSFSQWTVITDRHWEQLYKLFDENRVNVLFKDISENFVNAIIATEDQRFWTNPGVDRKGTSRALITDVTQWKTHGGSTITQQLIKQLMLTPEKKVERKLKEMILALRLNDQIRWTLKKNYPNLTWEELERTVKERILELYSNYIFFWNNAYGIQVASKTYFWVDARDLDVLQAAILAWIPQAPSRYDAYGNRALLMGEILIHDTDQTPVALNADLQAMILKRVEDNITSARLTFRKSNEALIAFMQWLLDFTITYEWQSYKVSYKPWRKDVVLWRMLEESYITESEFKKQFLRSLTFEFARPTIEIRAPHFVFWITRLLEQKYDSDILRQWWLVIKTTLDYEIQKMAEESIKENQATALQYNANNASMIYTDSINGDILAYVGSSDFFNEQIGWQVDMVQAKRQPWSTIKSFVYALWFMTIPLTLDSPIYDIPLTLQRDTPSNADGSFAWLTTIRQALAASRNIPAIKMLLMAWGESAFKQFFQKLWVASLDMTQDRYWYPIAIGANEMTMFELANAYWHLSAMGNPAVLDPILEIRARDWSLLYQKKVQQQQQVIPSWVAFLLRRILSDNSNMPTAWIPRFTIPWLTMATKTWTTNVVDPSSKKKFPRDWWLAAYTPSKVMVFWWWNTDGKPMRSDAFWWWINSTARRNFVKRLQTNWLIANQIPEQKDIASVSISKISWKLATELTPLQFVVTTLWYTKTLPNTQDASVEKIAIDILCNGLPTPLTPDSDLREAFILTPESPMPDKRDAQWIKERWTEEWGLEKFTQDWFIVLLEKPTKWCEEREMVAEQWEISLDLIQPTPNQMIARNFSVRHQTRSPFRITSLKIYLDDVELRSSNYNRQWWVMDITNVTIPAVTPPWTYTLKLVVTDEKWYTDQQTVVVQLIDNDTTPPFLMENRKRINKRADGTFEVVLLFNDLSSTIKEVSIQKDWEEIFNTKSNLAVFAVQQPGEISYTVIDAANNRWWWVIKIE
jgi:penicillin-binding protein 1A